MTSKKLKLVILIMIFCITIFACKKDKALYGMWYEEGGDTWVMFSERFITSGTGPDVNMGERHPYFIIDDMIGIWGVEIQFTYSIIGRTLTLTNETRGGRQETIRFIKGE